MQNLIKNKASYIYSDYTSSAQGFLQGYIIKIINMVIIIGNCRPSSSPLILHSLVPFEYRPLVTQQGQAFSMISDVNSNSSTHTMYFKPNGDIEFMGNSHLENSIFICIYNV